MVWTCRSHRREWIHRRGVAKKTRKAVRTDRTDKIGNRDRTLRRGTSRGTRKGGKTGKTVRTDRTARTYYTEIITGRRKGGQNKQYRKRHYCGCGAERPDRRRRAKRVLRKKRQT
jgi:hypothetical protein